eukprot:5447543-Pyramimonas_sp.AAC.1
MSNVVPPDEAEEAQDEEEEHHGGDVQRSDPKTRQVSLVRAPLPPENQGRLRGSKALGPGIPSWGLGLHLVEGARSAAEEDCLPPARQAVRSRSRCIPMRKLRA